MSKNIRVSILLLSTFLVACGGGGSVDSNNDKPSRNDGKLPIDTETSQGKPSTEKPQETAEDTNTPSVGGTPAEKTETIPISTIGNKNHPTASIAGMNLISLERQACGLGGLSYDNDLERLSVQHAQYIQHIFSNANVSSFNAHSQQPLVGLEKTTGINNPYYSGVNFKDRLIAANYPNSSYIAGENISHRTAYSSTGLSLSPDTHAIDMARGLLSAPYHMRTLVNPNMNSTGAGLVTYTPFEKDANTSKGYLFVTSIAGSMTTPKDIANKIITYPCAASIGVKTGLFNESPNPVQGTNRNLATDPIGHPVHIRLADAKTIKVSNVEIIDVKRNINIPINMIDTDNDPHKGTSYQLPANEAFILPITDHLKSCEVGNRKGQNCGLYGNSDYQVSFDILIDNKNLETRAFTFKTGPVNYS